MDFSFYSILRDTAENTIRLLFAFFLAVKSSLYTKKTVDLQLRMSLKTAKIYSWLRRLSQSVYIFKNI